MKHDVTHVTETITPEIAVAYLERNNRNRPIRTRRVRELAADMAAGRWKENGEAGITFDFNNDIAGGQHTLSAVAFSGVTIRCRVTRGVEPDVRSTMNDTYKQRFSDDLHVQGVKSSHRTESLLRKIMVWERAAAGNPDGLGGLARWQNARFSRAELAEAWPLYAEGAAAAISGAYAWQEAWTLVGNAGALEFMYWLLAEKNGSNRATVADFFDRMAKGSVEDDDQILTKVRLRMRRKPNTAPYQVYWMCRGWNSWTQDRPLAKMQLPAGRELSDPFPRLLKAR